MKQLIGNSKSGYYKMPQGFTIQWTEITIRDIIWIYEDDVTGSDGKSGGRYFRWTLPISFDTMPVYADIIEYHETTPTWAGQIARLAIQSKTPTMITFKMYEWQEINQNGMKALVIAIGY